MGFRIEAIDDTYNTSRLADKLSIVLFNIQIILPAIESSTHYFSKGV